MREITVIDGMVTIFIERILQEAFRGAVSARQVKQIVIDNEGVKFTIKHPEDGIFEAEVWRPWKYIK